MFKDWSRRTFIKTLSAGGAIPVALPVLTSGCSSSCEKKARVVIIGGGAAGLSLAARLRRSAPNLKLQLVDPAEKQFYQPGFTLIGGGVYEADEVWKEQKDLIPDGVEWIRKSVRRVNPSAKTVELDDATRLQYDFLVLTPGIQLNWRGVEGITYKTLGAGNAHSIYDWKGAQKTFAAMKEFAVKGGKGVFVDTYTKLKCGGAPKKICLMTEHRARKAGTRDRLDIAYYTAEKDLYDVKYFTPRLKEIYKERNIPFTANMRVTGVDTASKKVYFEKIEKIERKVKNEQTGVEETVVEKRTTSLVKGYDFLHFAPPQSAPDFVRESGLGWKTGKFAREAWVEVDKHTLVHRGWDNIISFGDVAGIPTSKTSAAIRMQLPVAERNLISLIEGSAPEAKYDGYAACPIITDYGHVLLCEFDYDKKEKISFPFSMLDMSKEQRAAWWLKVYVLKPMYFHGMLRGLM